MALGGSCTLDGIIASDSEKTGLMVCKDGRWSKITDPIEFGGACAPDGRVIDDPTSSVFNVNWYCTYAKWSTFPQTVSVNRPDLMPVDLVRPVAFNGSYYFLYKEAGSANNTSQTYRNIAVLLCGNDTRVGTGPETINTGKRGYPLDYAGCGNWHWSWKRLKVEIPTAEELDQIWSHHGGIPAQWSYDFHDGPEIWTANRADEHGSGNWWDHVTFNQWTRARNVRWNTDYRTVILKVTRPYEEWW